VGKSVISSAVAEDGGDKQADENNTSKSSSKGRKPAERRLLSRRSKAESDSEGESGHQFLNFRFVNYGFTDASSLPFDLRDVILLDNQSTVDLFYNPDLVSNIRETDEAYDVHGNGGDLTTYKKGYIENYGDVSFDDNAITNILCLKMSGKVPGHI
jgi:hypothetical protein